MFATNFLEEYLQKTILYLQTANDTKMKPFTIDYLTQKNYKKFVAKRQYRKFRQVLVDLKKNLLKLCRKTLFCLNKNIETSIRVE